MGRERVVITDKAKLYHLRTQGERNTGTNQGWSFERLAAYYEVSVPTVTREFREAEALFEKDLLDLSTVPESNQLYMSQETNPIGLTPVVPQLPVDCGYSDKYKATRPPTCMGGNGCQVCWNKWGASKGIPSPATIGVTDKDPYSHDFDTCMEIYKEWIGWREYQPSPPPAPVPGSESLILALNDLHAPFHDQEKFRWIVEEFKGKADTCIVAGDIGDFYNFSRYEKYRQHFTPQQEFRSIQAILTLLSESFPEVIIMDGNHDERFRKYMLRNGMEAGIVEALLYLDENAYSPLAKMCSPYDNVEIVKSVHDDFGEFKFFWQRGDLILGHPEVFSKIPNKAVGGFVHWLQSYALPKGMVKPFRMVGIGHTHMAGKTWCDYDVVGMEMGCLALTPDYAADPKIRGAGRKNVKGYSLFYQDRETGKTDRNRSNFFELE